MSKTCKCGSNCRCGSNCQCGDDCNCDKRDHKNQEVSQEFIDVGKKLDDAQHKRNMVQRMRKEGVFHEFDDPMVRQKEYLKAAADESE